MSLIQSERNYLGVLLHSDWMLVLHSDWMLVGYFVDFTSPYILKSIFTLLSNKQEVHLKSILKCRDLGKSMYVCQNHYMKDFLPHIVCPLWALNWNIAFDFDLICPDLTEKMLIGT